jgi:hypothetical protein
MIDFKANAGGGKIGGIINGPETSIGENGKYCSHPHSDEGNEKGLVVPQGKIFDPSKGKGKSK